MLEDWTKSIRRERIGNYDVIIVPKNTILYSGKSLIHNDKKTNNLNVSFYTTFDVATDYAFNPNLTTLMYTADYSAVYSYKLDNDLILLDMESKENYKRLRDIPNIPRYDENRDILKYLFDDGNERVSYIDIDNKFINWLCNNIKSNTIPVSGYGYTEILRNHNEIMICDNKGITNKIENIYRLLPFINLDYIYETKEGEITNKINVRDIYYIINNKRYNIYPIYYNKIELPYGADIDNNKKIYTKNKNIDKYLYTKELRKILVEYVYRLFNVSSEKEIMRTDYPKSYEDNLKEYNKLLKGEEETKEVKKEDKR